MQLFCLFFSFFIENVKKKSVFSVIQYVKDHCLHTQKSADFAIAHLRTRVLALTPKSQINNNETYADMTNRLLRNSRQV